MKRITGAFALLAAGLSGCVAFTAPVAQGDRKPVDARPVVSAPMHGGTPLPGLTPGGGVSSTPPGYSTWTAGPGHHTAGSSPLAARPTGPTPPGFPPNSVPLPDLRNGSIPTTTPTPSRPSLASGTADFQNGMPMAVTPPKGDADSSVRQASYAPAPATKTPDNGKLPEILSASLAERAKAAPAVPPVPQMPLAPVVTNSTPAPADAPKAAKMGGTPLLRLVNSRRITLNFEVKDVGPSGLAGVDLWYTQDGRDWKKHEAPANAQAYVVEVDEEGMYGFTLVARSGIGLGKEPPAAGDQPQVWVIVDLTKPDVKLTEVVPNYQQNAQHVLVRWQSSDKNLGRHPVTLSYAEKEEGPWTVIAANLDSSGQYTWQVPANVPPRALLKAEAIDLAGNVGHAQSEKPILMDSSRPNVSIVNVEANTGR